MKDSEAAKLVVLVRIPAQHKIDMCLKETFRLKYPNCVYLGKNKEGYEEYMEGDSAELRKHIRRNSELYTK